MKAGKRYLMNRIMPTMICITLCMLSLFHQVLQVKAQEKSVIDSGSRKTEIVFLIDTSASMNRYDKERNVIDAVKQMAYGLPSDYTVGMVAYNTGIQTIVPLDSDLKPLETALENMEYTGYTNAGEGLTQAIDLFSENSDTAKYVVMISDGEIDMPDKLEKEISRSKYVEAANLAKEKDIRVFIAAIGTEIDAQMHIFDGAELTDGAIYWEGQTGSIALIMEQIVRDRLEFHRQDVGITDARGGSINVIIPEQASRVKIVLTGSEEIQEVTADYQAESGCTVAGKKFAVVDMVRPSSEAINIYFQTKDLSGMKAYALIEYTAKPQVAVTYRIEEIPRNDQEIKKKVIPKYEHFADITIQLQDADKDHENIWKQEELQGQEITYLLNGASYTGTIEQGQIQTTIPAENIENVEVSINMEEESSIYYIEQPVIAAIEKYPDPVPEPVPDYRPLWVILGALALILAGIAALWIKKSRTTVIYMAPPENTGAAKKCETKSCEYTGKFNLYMIQTESGRDIAPQTFRMFGRKSGRITLDWILNSCKIKLGKIGSEDIIFYPGPDKSIIVMDQSERCTVMRGMEILKKGMGYPMFYNEKLTVTFEDGITEMEIHYKDLKPSEREG